MNNRGRKQGYSFVGNPFLKIHDGPYRLGSAWWMAAVFQLQYSLKYSMMPLYLKIVPRLRR